MTLSPTNHGTKSRVERERTDTGYGPGWVALVDRGSAAGLEAIPHDTWAEAYRFAYFWVYAMRDVQPHHHECPLGRDFHMVCQCACGYSELAGPGVHIGLWGSPWQV